MYQRILNQAEKKHKLIVTAFFILFFITAICVLKDYGLNWDEEAQWKVNGDIVFNYIFNGGKTQLLESNEKYHGPAFELALIFIEKIMQLKDTRDVYLMRHAVTFLTFFISVIVFYFLCKHIFKNWKLALLGCIFLVMSPRIFADSFYNSKDAVFLSLFIISMYALLIFHQKQTYRSALLYALICAFTIDTRILGIILPLISLGFIGLEFLYSFLYKKKPDIHYGSVFLFGGCLLVFVILFWPVLWEGPLYHFKKAFIEMSKYHWEGYVLYRGAYFKVTNLPWHYLPVWIGITTPLPYLIFFAVGLFIITKQVISKPFDFSSHKREQLLFLICLFLPILMVIVLKSVVYDAWRHVFFIYPSLIIIALYGVKYLYVLTGKKQQLFFTLLAFIIMFQVLVMIQLHPYQYVYFNAMAGKDMKDIKANYDLDYYGISSKQALDYLLEHDHSLKLSIFAEKNPLILNTQFLPAEQRDRIRFTELEDADYAVFQYRFHRKDYGFKNEYHSIMVGNASIMSIYKLTAEERAQTATRGITHLTFQNDFESPSPDWTSNGILEPVTGAHSGKKVTATDSVKSFSDVLKFTLPLSLCHKEGLIIKASYWKYEDRGSESSLVVTIQNGKTSYFWDGRGTKALAGTKNKWDEVFAKIPLAKVQSPGDTISVYLWNTGKKRVFMDDLKVKLIEKKGEQYKIEYLK